jgi:hypothetical protein
MAIHQLLESALIAASQRRQQIAVRVDAFGASWQFAFQVRISVAPMAGIFSWSLRRQAYRSELAGARLTGLSAAP